MCIPGLDPLTLALLAGSLASSVGGGIYNNKLQQDALDKQGKIDAQVAEQNRLAQEQERIRQQDLERRQAEEVSKSLVKANPADAALKAQEAVASKDNPIVREGTTYNTPAQNPDLENRTVDKSTEGYKAESGARTEQMVKAIAALAALDGGMASTNDQIGRSGSNIATLGSLRRGSLDASRLETGIQAPTVQPKTSFLGDALLLLGNAGSTIAGGQIAKGGGVDLGSLIMGARPKAPPRSSLLTSGGLY